ncbi:hypothetical protein DPMN_104690, partial [Dreissena polymorpha]
MTTEAVARRALCNVQAASWIVRFIVIAAMPARVLIVCLREVNWCGIVLICGKNFLYFWLFVLNCATTCLFIYTLIYYGIIVRYSSFKYSAIDTLLLVLALVTCLMLTVVNLYSFYILHKNGCCFMHRLKQDVDVAEASTYIGLRPTVPENIYSTALESNLPRIPPMYSAQVLQKRGSDFENLLSPQVAMSDSDYEPPIDGVGGDAVDGYCSYIYYDTSSVATILFIVYVVTSIMFTVMDPYTFCIPHKNGCFFMSIVRQDVEEVAGTET